MYVTAITGRQETCWMICRRIREAPDGITIAHWLIGDLATMYLLLNMQKEQQLWSLLIRSTSIWYINSKTAAAGTGRGSIHMGSLTQVGAAYV